MNTSMEVQVLQWFERVLAQAPDQRRAWLAAQGLSRDMEARVVRLLEADAAAVAASFLPETIVTRNPRTPGCEVDEHRRRTPARTQLPANRRAPGQLRTVAPIAGRRHGRGLPRSSRRRRLRTASGDQADPARAFVGAGRFPPPADFPVRGRAQHPRAHEPPQCRAHPRWRQHHQRHSLPGDGIRRRRVADRLLQGAVARRPRPAGAVRESL